MPKVALQNKMKEHNKKSKHKVTMRMLEAVYDRGVGAYRTNPGSVRPNVKSPEQWAMARVNSFLRIVSGSKSANHDKDLLPSSHPSSTKKMLKGKYANDIFTTEAEARARSMDIGLGGDIHVHEYDGQAVYMPGESHEDYLHHLDPNDKDTPSEGRLEALRVIVQEIMKEEFQKAEYQGRKVTLNKPRRIQGGNKKFEVFVMNGDKVKRDDPKARANFRSRHSCDTASDKTSARYWSCRMWEAGATVSDMTKNLEGKILKSDEEQRLVYGWASVVTEKGEPVVDRQGDIIKADTLVRAVNKFMEHVRVGKQMHNGDQIGVVVHSWPCTDEINKSVGLEADREGWLVAFKVYDEEVWSKVKSGELAAFSIGGRAVKGEYNGD